MTLPLNLAKYERIQRLMMQPTKSLAVRVSKDAHLLCVRLKQVDITHSRGMQRERGDVNEQDVAMVMSDRRSVHP